MIKMVCEEAHPALDKRIEPKRTTVFIYVVSILSALGGFLFGYDTGVVSGALVFFKDEFDLNHLWQEFIVSATILTAWIFSMIAGYVTEKWGRRLAIIFASFIFTIGSITMGIAWSKYILLLGRFIAGAAVGLASMTVPMYIAEVAPDHIRGKLVTINNCFITFGQFVAAVVAGVFSSDSKNGWRFMLGLAAIPALLQFFGFMFIPESPRWLIRHGKYQDALRILKRIRSDQTDVNKEFKSIKESYLSSERERSENGETSVFKQIFVDSSLRKALLIGCSLQVVQQLSGINIVMYYSATIIQMSGIRDKTMAIWLAAANAAINFVCTVVGLFLVEKIGRRLLTITSLAGVIISLSILATGFLLAAIETPSIGWHDAVSENTQCFNADTCFDCVRSLSCGYCYNDNSSSIFDVDNVNGTCLLVDLKNKDRAAVPIDHICSNGTIGNIVWTSSMCPSKYSIVTLFGLMLYLFFFAPGMGPMPWTINSEIYPLWARSVCFSIATSFNWFSNLIVTLTFLSLTERITKYGVFYLYATFAMIGWLFFFFKLPETKNKRK